MLALSLFTWWYGRGWVQTIENMYSMLGGIYKAFSVPILLRTLFAPWKRIVSYPGASLDAKLRAFGDNIVSRAVGFVVRMLVLMTAVVIEFGALVIGSIGIILWPLVPLVIVALIVKAVAG